MRICKKCGVEKELNAENFRSNGHAGFRHDCRECERGAVAQYRIDNPEKIAETTRKYSKNNRGKLNAAKKKWRANNLDRSEAIRRKSNYGITGPEFDAMFSAQKESCAICGRAFPGKCTGNRMLSPHVDHCHTTGKIRGLLCHDCNNLLARAKDSTSVLQSAIQYLLKSSK